MRLSAAQWTILGWVRFQERDSARLCSYEKTPMPNDFPGWYELQVGVKSRHGVMSELTSAFPPKAPIGRPTGSGAFGRPFCERPPRLSTLNLGSASASFAAAVSATETARKATSRRKGNVEHGFSLWTTVHARLHIGRRTPCCHRVRRGHALPSKACTGRGNHSWSKSASIVDWRQSSRPT